MRNLLAWAAVAFCTSAMAEQSINTSQVKVEPYHYGMYLDIASVISTTVPADKCNAAPVTMIYRDSDGRVKGVEYLTLSSDCDASGG